MLKKTMTYEDFNGEKVTEDFYFALSKAELIEMEMTAGQDGYAALLTRIIAEDDKAEILKTFRSIILKSVGRRSEDGRRFIKNDEIREEFEQTNAFSDLLVEFYSRADAAAEFVAGIVPSDMAETVQKAVADGRITDLQLPDGSTETVQEEKLKTWQDFSRNQLVAMPNDQFEQLTGHLKMQEMPRELLSVAMQRRAAGPQG